MPIDRWAASFYPHPPPIRVEHGIGTERQNGQMAQSWWSARLIEGMEEAGTSSRMKHGRRYARSGQIISLEISPGELRAAIQGSDPTPYVVVVRPPCRPDPELRRVDDELAARVGYSAELLAGELPRELTRTAGGTELVPRVWSELETSCSCPDEESPCKHLAAVMYIFAERIDADPWLLLEWLGRERVAPLDHLQSSTADAWPDAPWWPLRPGRGEPAVGNPGGGPRSALERLGALPEDSENELAGLYDRLRPSNPASSN